MTFQWTYYNNPFAAYEALASEIKKLLPKIRKITDELELVSRAAANSDIDQVIIDLRDATERANAVRSNLPRRPHSLQKIAVTFLAAFWVHERRLEGYVGPRDVVVSFNGDEPIHPSMRFILDMLARSRDGLLKSVGKTTIARTVKDLRGNVPLPSRVYPFEGKVDYFA